LHLDGVAGRERVRREPFLDLCRGDGPRSGKTVQLKVFEPHGRSCVRAKRTILSDDRASAFGQAFETWHLEDNLTLLKQLGAIKP
jgi:hypothetical protein